MQNVNEKIISILERAKNFSDEKTVDIIKEHISIKDGTTILDTSSLNLSDKEEDRIFAVFLAAL